MFRPAIQGTGEEGQMITVGTSVEQLPFDWLYKVRYDHWWPRDKVTFTKAEAIEFAIKLHAARQADCKAYGFVGYGNVFLHCPEKDVAEVLAEVKRRIGNEQVQTIEEARHAIC